MADIISRLKVDSTEYDSKIKRAAQGLTHLAESARNSGAVLNVLEKENREYIQSLGRMETVAKTARGRLGELTSAFTDIRSVYNSLTKEEKAGQFGRELNKQLEIMKGRIRDTKNELKGIDRELNGTGGKFGELGNVVNTLGSKMGLSGDLMGMLTSKTAMMTGAIGASVAVIYKATEAWAGYNSELAKQDQITTVTTGLKGPAADTMTDAARAMVDTYNVDFREAINAANTLMTQFGLKGDEATQLIRDGLRGMIHGDGPKLLQMIQQYAPAFRDAGVSASQLVAVIHNSEGGIFTDQNMNAIVMGIKNIRLMTKATSDALAQLGIDGKKMSQELSNGSLTIFDALKQVAGAIKNVDSNSQAAGEVMQQVFGRQGVTAGTNLGKAIETLNTNLEETKRQTGEVGDAMAELQTANEQLNRAIRDCFEYDGWDQMAKGIQASLVTALANVLQKIADIKAALGGMSVKQYQGDTKNGGGSFIDDAVDKLKGGKTPGKERMMRNQIQEYSRLIFNIDDEIRRVQDQYDTIANGPNINTNAGDGLAAANLQARIKELEKRRDAVQKNMMEYERRANEILNAPVEEKKPVTPITPITPTTKTTKGTTPKEQASKIVSDAVLAYNQTIEKARLEMESGLKTEADMKKANLSAQERLYDAYGKAYAIYADPKYKVAQDAAADEIVKLGGEVKTTTEQQKKVEQAARELEQAQKKLAESQRELTTARESGNLKDIYAAEKKVTTAQQEVTRLETIKVNVEQGKVDLPSVPTDDKTIKVNVEQGKVELPKLPDEQTIKVTYTDSNLQAFIGNLKERIGESEVGSDLYNALTKQLADATMLGNFISEAVKNGIDVADIDPQKLFSKIFGDGQTAGDFIPDGFWEGLGEQYSNATGKKFDVNTNTGEVKEGKEEDEFKKFNEGIGKLTGGLSSVTSGLKAVGVDIPKEVDQVVGVINGVSQVISGIGTLISLFGAGAMTANTTAVSLNTAAIGGLIAALEFNTASNFIPFFANGGIVPHAANGYFVGGNSFSGDNTPIMANAGELVLSKSQQGVLASMLTDEERGGGNAQPYLDGEKIYLGLQAYMRRSGLGEIVTSER